MSPLGPFTVSVLSVTTSGSVAFDAQSQYATRSVSAAVRYAGASSPTYLAEMLRACETMVCCVLSLSRSLPEDGKPWRYSPRITQQMADAMYQRVAPILHLSIPCLSVEAAHLNSGFTHIMGTHARLVCTTRNLTDTIPSLKWKTMYAYFK